MPGVVPHPTNETFQVLAIYDPLYAQPWLLATDLPIAAPDVKALYQDRWPVEQIHLAAKHMVGAHRQFVFAQESIPLAGTSPLSWLDPELSGRFPACHCDRILGPQPQENPR